MQGMHKLKGLREDRGLSQRELATLAGVALGTVLRAEKSYVTPRGLTARKLAAALGIEPLVLIRCGAPEDGA